MGALAELYRPNLIIADVALSLDTNAYISGDVLADTQAISNAFRVADGRGIIRSIVILDEDDQGEALKLVFMEDSTSIGTENAPLNIADAAARKILGIVEVAAGDYIDLINSQMVVKTGVDLAVKAASGTKSLYVAALSAGTGTYTAAGIRLRVAIEQL